MSSSRCSLVSLEAADAGRTIGPSRWRVGRKMRLLRLALILLMDARALAGRVACARWRRQRSYERVNKRRKRGEVGLGGRGDAAGGRALGLPASSPHRQGKQSATAASTQHLSTRLRTLSALSSFDGPTRARSYQPSPHLQRARARSAGAHNEHSCH